MTVSPERIEEALARLDGRGLFLLDDAHVIAAALREAQVDNARLREEVERNLHHANRLRQYGEARRLRQLLAVSPPADEAMSESEYRARLRRRIIADEAKR